MPGIYETAYPRLKSNPSENDLITVYTPTVEELSFAKKATRQPTAKLAFLVQMKVFQRLGYFISIKDTPSSIIEHIAKTIGVKRVDDGIYQYDASGTRQRHLKILRDYFKIRPISAETMAFVGKVAKETAETKDDPSDILNVVLEELSRSRFELPAFSTLLREATYARAEMNRSCFQRTYKKLSSEAKQNINDILHVKTGDSHSAWHQLKLEPKKPTVTNVRQFLNHMKWLKKYDNTLPLTFDIPQQKIKQFTVEARALNVANMNELKIHKRYTLAALLIRAQAGKAIDDIADIIIKIRQLIQAATCKSEEFNDFVQWVLFGGEGVIAENLRHEQRKIIKYNHLVANLIILYNVSVMTKTIGDLANKGYRIDKKILSSLAPFRRSHINRFGDYDLNMNKEIPPFKHQLPILADTN